MQTIVLNYSFHRDPENKQIKKAVVFLGQRLFYKIRCKSITFGPYLAGDIQASSQDWYGLSPSPSTRMLPLSWLSARREATGQE